MGILDRLLEPNVAQRLCTSKQFRINPWLEVVNWDSLSKRLAPAPFQAEAAKLSTEHLLKGSSVCLKAKPYDGPTAWFENFASQGNVADSPGARNSFTRPASITEDMSEEIGHSRMSISGFGGYTKKKKNSKQEVTI